VVSPWVDHRVHLGPEEVSEDHDHPKDASRRLRRIARLLSGLEKGDVFMTVVSEVEALYTRMDIQLMFFTDEGRERVIIDRRSSE
jgi:hypothetical protein